MPDQLTSVRFDGGTLERLRFIAEVRDTNVAEEIRQAVRAYIDGLTSDDDFRALAEESVAKREAQVQQFLAPMT